MDERIEAVRAFNRFYTRHLGLLDQQLYKSDFTLTECRVLQALARGEADSPAAVARTVGLDMGYLSRILTKLEGQELIARAPDPADARASLLSLTDAGRTAFAPVDEGAIAQVRTILEPLDPFTAEDLLSSMGRVRQIIEGSEAEVVIRDLERGDTGWVIHRQADYYGGKYGFDLGFDRVVTEIMADYLKTHDPATHRAFIAERDGFPLGSLFLADDGEGDARLRLMFVEPEARGLGLGRRLLEESVAFAREAGYARVVLWTHSFLLTARKIYERAGFTLVSEKSHTLFGPEVTGEEWVLVL